MKNIITIGRQFGSGGLRIAKEIGSRLGIPVYDSELILKAAQDSGFSAELFIKNDEKKETFFSSVFGLGSENCTSENGLFHIQCDTIQRIAEQGPAIIVGRCADYVLRERNDVLSVFITAPLEARTERIMERLCLDYDKAQEKIGKMDRRREEYYNYYTFGNWGQASTYDLCIDSSILGIKGTAEFIISLIERTTAGNVQE